MLSAAEILSAMEGEERCKVKTLAKKLQIPPKQLERILQDLSQHNLVEYDQKYGEVKLASWLAEINREMEDLKPAVGTIILPKNQKINLQDIVIGNYTELDLELNVRLDTKIKEIAISKIS
jgi:DNA-binding MarR family transcriptional regulator